MDRKKGGGNLGDTKYIKINLYLFLGILPLSIVGYYFAVNKENLFFLYEWSILLLIVASLIFSIIGFKKNEGNSKWISLSYFAFFVQFSVLCLFLGPFSFYKVIFVFYITTFITILIMVMAIRKIGKFKFMPILLLTLSLIFTIYVMFLNSLWGTNWN
jgi:hypothetical protein